MKTTNCPFCIKATLKGYPFTPYSGNSDIIKEPYDTAINKACRDCIHCEEMEQAIARTDYDGLTRFCLSYVNGKGEFKSLNIRFGKETTVYTTPYYKQEFQPTPYKIGTDETQSFKSRLYALHAELWADSYGSDDGECYTWWELFMTFQNGKTIRKQGTNALPPQWNRLLEICGAYYKWMKQDSPARMYELKYNHITGLREKPKNCYTPFTDYWATANNLPTAERLFFPDDIQERTKVCIFARPIRRDSMKKTEKQIEACRKFCKLRRLEIVAEYFAEQNNQEQEFRRMIAEAKEKGFTYIILATKSHLSRDMEQAIEIRKELAEKGLKTIILPPKKWGQWRNY